MSMKNSAFVIAAAAIALSGCSHTSTSAEQKAATAQEAGQELQQKQAASLKKEAKIAISIPAQAYLTHVLGNDIFHHASPATKNWAENLSTREILAVGSIAEAGHAQAGWSFVPGQCVGSNSAYCQKHWREAADIYSSGALWADRIEKKVFQVIGSKIYADPGALRIAAIRALRAIPASWYKTTSVGIKKITRVTPLINLAGSCSEGATGCFAQDGRGFFFGMSGISYQKDGITWFGKDRIDGRKIEFEIMHAHDISMHREKAVHQKSSTTTEQHISAGTGAKAE